MKISAQETTLYFRAQTTSTSNLYVLSNSSRIQNESSTLNEIQESGSQK